LKSVRWLIATALVVVVFAVAWAISSDAYDLGKATSLEIAAVLAAAIGLPLSWWSFRGQLMDEPAEVAWTTWRRLPGTPSLALRRARDESRLDGAFQPGTRTQVVVLTGPSGVGKTQLAAGYARARIAEGWPLVAWVNAGSHEEMVAGLLEFADALSLRVPEEGSTRALERLRQHPPTGTQPSLLVFDGVRDLDALRAYLPTVAGWRVIVTSDAADSGEPDNEVPVEPPNASELTGPTGFSDEICEELGRLPVVLDLAAATQREQGQGAAQYLNRLRSVVAGPLLGDGRDGSHYQERYPTAAAEVALVALRDAGFDRDSVVRRVLGLLTVLSPGGVSRALLYQAGEQSELEDAVTRLGRWSLAAGRMDGDGVVLHEMIRRLVADRLRSEDALPKAIADAADLLDRATFGEEQAWDRRGEGDQLIAHIAALSTSAGSVSASLPTEITERVLSLRQWATRQLSAVGDGNRAVELAESIRTECETLLGAEHPDSLVTSDNLVIAYVAARRSREGIPLAEEVLDTRERVLGPDHQDTLVSRYTLAYVNEYAGRLDKAVELYDRAYSGYLRTYGQDNSQTQTVATALARVRAVAPAQVAGRHRDGHRPASHRPTG
jgi:Tetratricopeptide repeat